MSASPRPLHWTLFAIGIAGCAPLEHLGAESLEDSGVSDSLSSARVSGDYDQTLDGDYEDVRSSTCWAGTTWTLEALLQDLTIEDAYGNPDPDDEASLALSLILSELDRENEDAVDRAVVNTIEVIGYSDLELLSPAEQVEVIIAVSAWQGFDLVAELEPFAETGIELGILAPSPSQTTARSNPFTVVRVVVGGLLRWFKNHAAEECESVAISRRTACEAKAKSCRVAGGQPFKAFRIQDYEEDRGVTFAQGIPPQYMQNDCNFYCWVGCSFGNGEYWTYNGQDGKTVHN